MIEQSHELPQTKTNIIHSRTIHYANLQEYITYALEVILLSVTDLFLVKLCMCVCFSYANYNKHT